MSDVEDSVATDGVGAEVTNDQAGAGADSAAETVEAAAPAGKAAEKGSPGKEAAAEEVISEAKVGADGKPVVEAYRPNLKFKVMDKEHEIPKEFSSLMKDEKTEKQVREIFEKAYGLDVVKTKLNEVRAERVNLEQENTQIKGSIDGLRSIYQGAVRTGNLLKLDDFFARLQIPEEVVLKYALAKVQFAELPPEQRQILAANMSAEKRAEMLEQQQQQTQTQLQTQQQQMKSMQLQSNLARDDVRQMASDFDARVGKPGAFREQVVHTGNLAWFQEGVDLTPEQAIEKVISTYGLKVQAPGNAAIPVATPGAGAPSGKRVIQRETNTIPNVQGRSSSPLKGKPRSVEDLKKLHKHYADAER